MSVSRTVRLGSLAAALIVAVPLAGAFATPATGIDRPADRVMRAEPVQDVIIRRGPPPPRHERMGRRPDGPRGHWTWRRGHYNWDGARYVWVPGSYVERPRPRAVWVADRWVRRGGNWVFIEGHWR
ncbi:MAG: YXWGXW repeat-containing protein [Alphaproteobacteria bacterium]|nr:YXWGXW repeat-containing protein [Alphaproteobacteria bacterium]